MIEQLLGDYKAMMDSIGAELDKRGITGLETCDHLCYRVETVERYEELVGELSDLGENIGSNIVSGRPITIFKLHEPLMWRDLSIACLELPAPKDGSFYREGWEHAEFVIPELNEFREKHQDKLNFNTKSMGRCLNPELGLKINDRYQVKFHPLHIMNVIETEKQLKITQID